MTPIQILLIVFLAAAVILALAGVFGYRYAKTHLSAPRVVSGQIGMGRRRFGKKLRYVFVFRENGKEISAFIPDKDGIRHAGKPRVKAVVRQGRLLGPVPIYAVNVLAK